MSDALSCACAYADALVIEPAGWPIVNSITFVLKKISYHTIVDARVYNIIDARAGVTALKE